MLPTGGYTGYFQLRCCVGARATRLSDVHEDEVMIVATRSSMPGDPNVLMGRRSTSLILLW